MQETIDTASRYNNSSDIPDGTYTFEVVTVRKKYKGEIPFYIWTLEYDKDQEGDQVLLPSMMGDLLRVLGCKEISPKKYEWDPDNMEGKEFIATVSHEPDKKDPSKMRQQMTNFRAADLPF